MNSFLRHLFLRLFWVPLTTVFYVVFGSSLMANDGLDKDLPVIGKPIPNGVPKPGKTLEEYKSMTYPYAPGIRPRW